MKIHLVSFADSSRIFPALRFYRQARESGYFSTVRVLSEFDLPRGFFQKLGIKNPSSEKGFGYWTWKPQVIANELQNLDKGDLLVYLDIGFHIEPARTEHLSNLLEVWSKTEHFMICSSSPRSESSMTKSDVFKHFGVLDNEAIVRSPQLQAGALLFRACDESVEFVTSWQRVVYDHFSLVSDEPSREGNFSDFTEHRHDQSVFSVLAKLADAPFFDGGWMEQWRTDAEKTSFPFQARRDHYPGKLSLVLTRMLTVQGRATFLNLLRWSSHQFGVSKK